MKTTIKLCSLVFVFSFLFFSAAHTQTTVKDAKHETKATTMKTYVIEREMPGVGTLSAKELQVASQTSCTAISQIGPKIQWLHSYVTGNKTYCVYKAENEEQILEHAQKSGFPANKIHEVLTMIGPETAKQ